MPTLSPSRAAPTALIIGQPDTCLRLERQLDLLEPRPISLGWVLTHRRPSDVATHAEPILGTLDELEAIIARRRPALALVSLPSVMRGLITQTRTRLRRMGVPDRFMPTLEDQLAGVGPRTHYDIDIAALIDRPPREIDRDAVRDILHGKRVAITGAGGTIGGELSRLCCEFQPELLVLIDRSEHALFEIDRQAAVLAPKLPRRALLHDVVEPQGTLTHFRDIHPHVVFHAAAHKHVPMMEDHPRAAVENNLFGTKSVADASHETGVERFVMISTDKAVNPSSIMGATKRLAELYVQHLHRRSSTAFAMVRFGNVLGSSGSVLSIWERQLAEGGPISVTDPRMTRYFMTIPEAAALVLQAAALVDPASTFGEVFLLDMGQPLRIVELAQRFARLHGLVPRLPDDAAANAAQGTIDIVFTGARPGEKLFEELSFDAEAMRPTRHPDINIWMLPQPDDRYITKMLRTLDPKRRADATDVAAAVRDLVPEMTQPESARGDKRLALAS